VWVHFKPVASFFQTQKPFQAQAVHPTARPGIPRRAALPGERRGAVNVRRNHIRFYFARQFARFAQAALANGTAGIVVVQDGRPLSVLGFTVKRGKIVEIDGLADPERLRFVFTPQSKSKMNRA
jgi:hypothetical protein